MLTGFGRSFRPLAAVCPRRDLPVPMKSVAGRYITSEPVLAPRVLVPAKYELHFDQQPLIDFRKRQIEVGDLQDPEPSQRRLR